MGSKNSVVVLAVDGTNIFREIYRQLFDIGENRNKLDVKKALFLPEIVLLDPKPKIKSLTEWGERMYTSERERGRYS